jgi:hypothetical protein
MASNPKSSAAKENKMHIRRTGALDMMTRVVCYIEETRHDDSVVLINTPTVHQLGDKFQPAMMLFNLGDNLKVVIAAYMPDGLQNTYVVSYGPLQVAEMKTCIFIDDESSIATIADKIYRYLTGDASAFEKQAPQL